MQVDQHEEDPDAILQEDGTYLYKGPKGRLETWKERQARLQHNQKMVFNRSFRYLIELLYIFLYRCCIYTIQKNIQTTDGR